MLPGGADEGNRLPRDLKRVTTSETSHIRAATMEPSTPPLPLEPADRGYNQRAERQLGGVHTYKEGIKRISRVRLKWSKQRASDTARSNSNTAAHGQTHSVAQ